MVNGVQFNHPRPQHLPWPFAFALAFLASAGAFSLQAVEVWDGPLFEYSQPSPDPTLMTNQDRITPDMWLTRASSGGLFNAFFETNATALSPTNTGWAFGVLTNYASLTYTNWLAWLNGNSPTTMVGSNIVVHLMPDDIYLSFKFSFWAAKGAGGFAYQRSTPQSPVLFNSPANLDNGQFNFSYTALPGTNYVIQSSTNLSVWLPLSTNTAAVPLVPDSEPLGAGQEFFRVVQLANPTP
jgi:hypothetical protein